MLKIRRSTSFLKKKKLKKKRRKKKTKTDKNLLCHKKKLLFIIEYDVVGCFCCDSLLSVVGISECACVLQKTKILHRDEDFMPDTNVILIYADTSWVSYGRQRSNQVNVGNKYISYIYVNVKFELRHDTGCTAQAIISLIQSNI